MKDFSGRAFVSIIPVGLNDSEKEKFASILTIADFRLDFPWKIVDSGNIDFYLLGSRLRSQMDQDPALQSLPRKQCIFCTHSTINRNDNELFISRENIPSLGSLVLLFNHLTSTETVSFTHDCLSVKPQPAEVNHHPASSNKNTLINNTDINLELESEYFDPEQGFVGQLLSGEKGIRCFYLENETGLVRLYIHPKERNYYCNNKLELLNTFFSCSEPLSPQSLSEEKLQQHIANEGLKPQPLSNLIWYSTFICSQGKVIKGYNQNDIVRLKRWPNINIPGCKKLIKLAAYMQSNAVDLQAAQKQTGIPIEQIYNFYNACKVIGLIEHMQQTDIYEKNLDDEKRQLFADIGKRLNQSKRS